MLAFFTNLSHEFPPVQTLTFRQQRTALERARCWFKIASDFRCPCIIRHRGHFCSGLDVLVRHNDYSHRMHLNFTLLYHIFIFLQRIRVFGCQLFGQAASVFSEFCFKRVRRKTNCSRSAAPALLAEVYPPVFSFLFVVLTAKKSD